MTAHMGKGMIRARNAILRAETNEYIRNIGGLSAEETTGLHEWAESGNSVRDNPSWMSDESGRPMDYINAIRACDELRGQRMHPRRESLGQRAPSSDAAADLPF